MAPQRVGRVVVGHDDVPAEVGDRLAGLLRGLVARPRIHHGILAAVSGDGRSRWSGAASSDDEQVRPDSSFHYASVTKLYTAAAVLQLAESGDIALDEPIGAYLPRTLIEGIHVLDGADRSGQVTLRHLLSHTSGLPDYFLATPPGGESFDARLIAGDFSFTVEDVVARVRELEPYFPPQDPSAGRQRARYADTNFQLLGAVVEAVTGQTFQQVVEARILSPLGLEDTWFAGHPRRGDPPQPTSLWAGDDPLDRPKAMACIAPEGGLIGTASDALVFMRALISGEVFTRPDTAAEMRARFNRFGLPREKAALAAPGWPIAYGLGIKRFRIARLFAPGWKPVTLIGHSGASGSWLFWCPELDLYLAGTVDQASAAAVPFRWTPKVLRAWPH